MNFKQGDAIEIVSGDTHHPLNGLKGIVDCHHDFPTIEGSVIRGYDVYLDSSVGYSLQNNAEGVPTPENRDAKESVNGDIVMMKKIFVPTINLKKMTFDIETQNIKNKFAPLIFRRVFNTTYLEKVNTYKEAYDGSREEFLEEVNLPKHPHNQKNEWLKYHKQCLVKKGNYLGTTTNKPIRKNDLIGNVQINFYPSNRVDMNEHFDLVDLPDENARYDIPYKGDLICGTVQRDENGWYYYSKWFLCSEQFLMLWTFVVQGDVTAKNLNNFKNRLTLKQKSYAGLNEEEIEKIFHRYRYESVLKNYPYGYVWIAFLVFLGNVSLHLEGDDIYTSSVKFAFDVNDLKQAYNFINNI